MGGVWKLLVSLFYYVVIYILIYIYYIVIHHYPPANEYHNDFHESHIWWKSLTHELKRSANLIPDYMLNFLRSVYPNEGTLRTMLANFNEQKTLEDATRLIAQLRARR